MKFGQQEVALKTWVINYLISVYFVVIRSIGDSSQKQIITNKIHNNGKYFLTLSIYSDKLLEARIEVD